MCIGTLQKADGILKIRRQHDAIKSAFSRADHPPPQRGSMEPNGRIPEPSPPPQLPALELGGSAPAPKVRGRP
ncbi:hypothetical protein JCM16408A_28050 [Methylobacterium phyllosphaerae]